MPRIKAVLFDMDGVLIDARDWHYDALNRALEPFGMEINRYDHLVTYDGLPTKKKLEMLTIERGLPLALHKFINEIKQEFTFQLAYANCKPTFNHQFALATLKKNGYRLVACSNSIRKTMDIFFEKAALSEYFDFYLSNEDVVDAKPSPEIYLKAMSKLGLSPEECLILEDNENGVRAARSSGANVLVVRDPKEVSLDKIMEKITEIELA